MKSAGLHLDVEAAVKDVDGTRSAFADRVVGGKYLEITPNRDELARQNIDLGMFQQSYSNHPRWHESLAESVQGRERYNIMLRYETPVSVNTPEDLANILGSNTARSDISHWASWQSIDVCRRPTNDKIRKCTANRLGIC